MSGGFVSKRRRRTKEGQESEETGTSPPQVSSGTIIRCSTAPHVGNDLNMSLICIFLDWHLADFRINSNSETKTAKFSFKIVIATLQMKYGIIGMGEGNFIIHSYPVAIHYADLIWVEITVLIIGLFASWYPAKVLSKRLLKT